MEIKELQSIIQKAAQNEIDTEEMKLLAKQASLMPAYQDNTHPLHREAVDAVEKCYSLAYPEEAPTDAEAGDAAVLLEHRLDMQDPKGRLNDYKRRERLRLYGPKKGFDCPAWRKSLPEDMQDFMQAELGDPSDKDPVDDTPKPAGSLNEAFKQALAD